MKYTKVVGIIGQGQGLRFMINDLRIVQKDISERLGKLGEPESQRVR